MQIEPSQLSQLLSYCVEFAKEMLEREGSFLPFGAILNESAEVVAVGFWDGDEHPLPTELYQFAIDAVRGRAATGEILSAALAVDVNIPPQFESEFSDGVRVKVESSGYARLIYIPYVITRTGFLKKKRSAEFGEMIAVEAVPDMFVH